MPETSPKTEPATPMPVATKVAIILLALQGVMLLLNSALLWVGQDAAVDALAASPGDRDEAAQQLLLFLIAYAFMGLCGLVAAAFLPRRRAWARLVGVLTTSLLATITLFFVLTSGVTPYFLLILVTSLAAVTSLSSGDTKEWVGKR